jgi:hypothetical protein
MSLKQKSLAEIVQEVGKLEVQQPAYPEEMLQILRQIRDKSHRRTLKRAADAGAIAGAANRGGIEVS